MLSRASRQRPSPWWATPGSSFRPGYSPDGSKIVTTSQDGTIRVWDASTGKVVKTLVGHGPGLLGTDGVIDAAFNPDLPGQPGSGGTLLATAGLDGTVKVWDLATGKVQQTLTGHTSEVRSVNFSPDGAKLVTAGGDRDGTVRVWDLRCAALSTGAGGTQVSCSVSGVQPGWQACRYRGLLR